MEMLRYCILILIVHICHRQYENMMLYQCSLRSYSLSDFKYSFIHIIKPIQILIYSYNKFNPLTYGQTCYIKCLLSWINNTKKNRQNYNPLTFHIHSPNRILPQLHQLNIPQESHSELNRVFSISWDSLHILIPIVNQKFFAFGEDLSYTHIPLSPKNAKSSLNSSASLIITLQRCSMKDYFW